MAENQSRGGCVYCGQKMTSGGLARHLASCSERKKIIAEADAKPGKDINLYHLSVKELYTGEYWLHLEMAGNASLEKLDHYLRSIWLECCDHLSQFSYERWGEEIPMRTLADRIFRKGTELIHIYDFGSSSETKIRVVSSRRGKPTTPHPIALMARNDPPEYLCQECGEPASWLCMECLYENKDATLCDAHAKTHPHDEYGDPLPLLNSPRVGMCGYMGPADPPY